MVDINDIRSICTLNQSNINSPSKNQGLPDLIKKRKILRPIIYCLKETSFKCKNRSKYKDEMRYLEQSNSQNHKVEWWLREARRRADGKFV